METNDKNPIFVPKIVHIHGEIDDTNAAKAIDQMYAVRSYMKETVVINERVMIEERSAKATILLKKNPEITLRVSSTGGGVYDMLSILDTMENLKRTIAIKTIATGYVMSAAVPLIAFGTKGRRFAGKRCQFMIHGIAGGAYGKLVEIVETTKHLKHLQKLYIEALLATTNFPPKKFEEIVKSRGEFYFTSQEALKFGIIDKIID